MGNDNGRCHHLVELKDHRHTWFRNTVGIKELTKLRAAFSGDDKPGERIDIESALHQLIQSSNLSKLIANHFPGMKPVRLVSFDKTSEAAWALPWHQDRVIAVQERHEINNFKN